MIFSPQVFPAKWLIFRPTNDTKHKNPGPRSPVLYRWPTDMLTNVGVVMAAERAALVVEVLSQTLPRSNQGITESMKESRTEETKE